MRVSFCSDSNFLLERTEEVFFWKVIEEADEDEAGYRMNLILRLERVN